MEIADVQRWFLEEGEGRITAGVVVQQSSLGGHGVFLDAESEPLAANTEVLSIPLKSCPSSADERVAKLAVNSLFRLTELLVVELLEGAASPWARWFASCPKQCGNWPEWREAELRCASVGPPQLFEAVNDKMKKLPGWYKALSEALPDSALAGLDDKTPFRRALALLFSRRYAINCPGCDKVAACVPVGDLINHSTSTEANVEVVYEQATDRIKFITLREITPAEEILYCYADYDNLELCLNYGFVLDNNPLDKICLADNITVSRGTPFPCDCRGTLEWLLGSLPPTSEDELVASTVHSSPGCKTIVRWRQEYRRFLADVLDSSTAVERDAAAVDSD